MWLLVQAVVALNTIKVLTEVTYDQTFGIQI